MFSGRVDPVVQKSDKKWFLKFLPQRAGFAVPIAVAILLSLLADKELSSF